MDTNNNDLPPNEMLVIPRQNYIAIKRKTVEFGTGRVKKEWTEYVTFFTFFKSIDEIN